MVEAKQKVIGEELKDLLKDALPHGSGIDCEWEFIVYKNGNVDAVNSFHKMNENGMYVGFVDFRVKLFRHKKNVYNSLKGPLEGKVQIVHRKGDLDMDLYCSDTDLREYLYETIYHSLLDKGILSSQGVDIIDKDEVNKNHQMK